MILFNHAMFNKTMYKFKAHFFGFVKNCTSSIDVFKIGVKTIETNEQKYFNERLRRKCPYLKQLVDLLVINI
jgi:hypothetical protein